MFNNQFKNNLPRVMADREITKLSYLLFCIAILCEFIALFLFLYANFYPFFTITLSILSGIMFFIGFCMVENKKNKIQKNQLKKDSQESIKV